MEQWRFRGPECKRLVVALSRIWPALILAGRGAVS